ncbi:SDR family oxidoreductase [Streptomyces sp. NPDC018352]|uniref:SDR family NAD(P)-dependent oxidoreductase n=1 Tax=Streptomyces sp. NPDC018352 TaxID=3157194 RepID=UPI0033CF25BE
MIAGHKALPRSRKCYPQASDRWIEAKTAAMEFADWRVRVNMLHPGLVHTPLIAGTTAYEAMASMTPMGRAAEASEFARVALFLASDDSSFMTGVDVPVDGGFESVSAYRRVWQIVQGEA